MNIGKAIKLIQDDINNEDVEWNSPLGRAYKLSFEALKYISDRRKEQGGWITSRLPGETK